jgi:ferrous iron transport protein B
MTTTSTSGSHSPPRTGGVALLGCPNSGKSSLFNQLTGSRARTANYPGATVTVATSTLGTGPGAVPVTDLPGTYGLSAVSPDEQLVVDHLAGDLPRFPRPDALLLVLDATTLRRSLSLVGQALSGGRPCAVALTMTDELRSRGGDIDPDALAEALGVDVFEVLPHRGRGVPALREAILRHDGWSTAVVPPPTDDDRLRDWITSVARRAGYRPAGPSRPTHRIDRVLLHPVWGVLAFLAIMFVFFQTIFTVAAPAMDLIDSAFSWLGAAAVSRISDPLLADFVGTALIGGVGGVVIFLPQIVLLFFLISLLESSGYLARAAFLMDRVMAVSGLDGRAFVAMLSSVACAIPGIMATRTMPSSRDRIATMLAAPLMPCAARLPVYLLLVGLLVPQDAAWGPIGLQGLTLFGVYLAGGLAALLAALAARSSVLRAGGTPFYLELPPYRMPAVRTVLTDVGRSAGVFLKKVATIILIANIALWALLSFPHREAETIGMSDQEASAYVLENSYAADVGKAVEPVFEPLGFDWRIDVGLISALAAREVFVSALGQMVAAEDPEDPAAALHDLTYTDGPRAGEAVMTAPTIAALLAFFIFALQCLATIAVIRRESNSWRWPLLAFGYLTVLAWVAAFVTRTVVSALT